MESEYEATLKQVDYKTSTFLNYILYVTGNDVTVFILSCYQKTSDVVYTQTLWLQLAVLNRLDQNSLHSCITWKHFTLCRVSPAQCCLNHSFQVNTELRLSKVSSHPQRHQSAP